MWKIVLIRSLAVLVHINNFVFNRKWQLMFTFCTAEREATRERCAEKLKKDILNKFSQNTLEGTPQVTGFMEVTVNGKLVHSKKNGDGYVNTPEKLEKIFAAIQASLSC
ncbi:Selenoprotein W [Trichinella papuae]|uniref:Selenoprotein W n=1 Tax=Trichinella papuae TaxID=268474 RepID=A0A0V1MJ34_9BILA|nr:Selenoprotein W [Trichinella papuae]